MSMTIEKIGNRRGRKPAARSTQLDMPWTMKLPDGRTLVVEVPGCWLTADRDGTPALLPEGVRFIDRVRVLCADVGAAPSPGYLLTLREALGLTQAEMARKLGVDKLTVARWEWGAIRPRAASLESLRALRRQAIKRGVVLPG